MQFEIFEPSKYLTNFVKCYWALKKDAYLHTERLFPTGETQIIFHYGEPFQESNKKNDLIKQPDCVVCGQFTAFKEIVSKGKTGLFGIVFHPYALKTILKIPAYELTNLSIELTAIDRRFSTIKNKVLEAKNTSERVRVVENFLIKEIIISNIQHLRIVMDCIKKIEQSNLPLSIGKLAESYFVGERQLERIFKVYVGISPKSYLKISRFAKVERLMSTSLSLTQIAYEVGYFDQAHFIKSFKEISGYSPKEYRSLQLLTA